jgi:hypothetical protein
MGTTLTGTTPQDTYDSLIKVTDNGPISGTLKALSDGLGNDSTLSLSTTAASLAGTLAVTGNATLTSNGVSVRLGSATANAGANILIAGASSNKNWSIGVQQNISGGLEFTPTATNGALTLGTTPAMVILDSGNVGIGTAAPNRKLVVVSADSEQLILTSTNASNLCGMFINPANTTFSPFIGGTGNDAVVRIEAAERIRVTANGLTFNGDTAAANALDDYEEGTWTMGVSFGGASVGVSYGANTGRYTKIGNQVTVTGYLSLLNKGSSTGTAVITGLPFAIPNNNANYSAASLWLNTITFANQFQAFGAINSTTISLQEITELGAVTLLDNTDFANTSSVVVSLTYFV